jgi:two-component system response regulator NreC
MIADDHQIFREGFFTLFKKRNDIIVVGEAEDGKELLKLAKTLKPDVVFMDIKMPVMDGIEATAALKKQLPATKVIALSMFNDDNLILEMMDAGAKGYLLKNTHKTEVANAIFAVCNDEVYYCKETSDKLIRLLSKSQVQDGTDNKPPFFTPKEISIITQICKGHSNKEMSDTLHLSIRTIEGYRNKIHEKMKVHNTAGIVVYAIKHSIFQVP